MSDRAPMPDDSTGRTCDCVVVTRCDCTPPATDSPAERERMPKRNYSPQEVERLEAAAREAGKTVTLVTTLTDHWLYQVECDHQAKTDRAHCSCGRWSSEAQPSVGKAVEKWAVHVALIVEKREAGCVAVHCEGCPHGPCYIAASVPVEDS